MPTRLGNQIESDALWDARLETPLLPANGHGAGAAAMPRVRGPRAQADGLANDVAARRGSTYRRLLGVADLLSAAVALVATGAVMGDGSSLTLFAALIVLVPVAKITGLYDRDEYVLSKTTLDEVPQLLTVSLVFVMTALAARDVLITNESPIGAGHLLALTALTLAFLAAGRVTARRLARAVTPAERCLVIGDSCSCAELAHKIESNPAIKALVVGRVPVRECAPRADDFNLLGAIGDLWGVVQSHSVDRLIVVPDSHDPEEMSEVIRAVKSFGVKVSISPRLLDAVGSSIEIDEIGGLQLLGVRDLKMSASSRFLKRSLDLAGAAGGLLLGLPLFLLAALAIKIESPGPVFYRQQRVGCDGEIFEIVKFRSMCDGAHDERESLMHLNETSGLFKMQDDPRVTRVGKLLRRTSLDELPQLINVVRGDMSLVGPRPLVPEEDENVTGWYRRRSRIMPGITGVWQLLGPVRIPLEEMVKIDYLYVTHWSLWSDVKILLRTVPYVLGRRGL